MVLDAEASGKLFALRSGMYQEHFLSKDIEVLCR